MKQVLADIERLQRRVRTILIVRRSAVIVSWLVGTLLALALLDYFIRPPAALRLLLLLVGLGILAVYLRRYLTPAFVFRPSMMDIALRIEQSLPALRSRFATSVEFVLAGVDTENPLASRSVRETQSRLAGESFNGLLKPAATIRNVAVLSLVTLLILSIVVVQPSLARTGLERLVLPFGSAQWPARTAVISLLHEVIKHNDVYPRGRALPLRARNLTEGGREERVDAHYRLMIDGEFESWRRVVLTHQTGSVHERLIDTDAAAVEVYFATEDARTETERIQLVPPPAVVRAELNVRPPEYASECFPATEIDLGTGLDQRAVAESAGLEGSIAELTFTLNKPLPVPTADDGFAEWLAATFEWSDEPAPQFYALPAFEDTSSPCQVWSLSWSLRGTRSLTLNLTDEHGLSNDEPIGYRIEAVPDYPPSVIFIEPATDESVTPQAVITLLGEAKDDVALARLGIETRLQRGDAAAEESMEYSPELSVNASIAEIQDDLDLSDHDLRAGDVVLVNIVAEDMYVIDGQRRGPVLSAVRKLRVIDETELAEDVRRRLAAVRQTAIRIEALQGELQEHLGEMGIQPGLRGAQARIGDSLADQRKIVEQLRRQLTRNRLSDQALAQLIDQSGDLVDYAGRASNRAVEAIEREDGEATGGPHTDQEGEAASAQQDVRDELTDLIELLDRDEDAWLVKRRLENLLDSQSRLQERTSRLADETIGQTLDDLNPSQLTELDAIAGRQLELRDQSRELIDEMRDRADALEELDPASASGMRAAAETGERRNLDRDMETAARRAEQNQLRNAGTSQQSALETLKRMQGDLEQTKQARAEELLRKLAGLIESIDLLIMAQRTELAALGAARSADDYSGRDTAMTRLSRNTQTVASDARAASNDARAVARALDRAADAQGAAVSSLRARPVGVESAREAEKRSLSLLEDAKRLADDLRNRTRQEQTRERREELIEAYRRLAEKQTALREETTGLLEKDRLTRRELVEARRQGNIQDEIRTGLLEIEDATREIGEAEIFEYVHRLMDRWCSVVSEALWDGVVDINTTDHQLMVAESIVRQIEALEEQVSPPDEFVRESNSGSGAGGSSGPPPLILPVAEIRRIYGLQEQVYDRTRSLDGRADLSDEQKRERLSELGTMQRELMRIGEAVKEKLLPPKDEPEEKDAPGSMES